MIIKILTLAVILHAAQVCLIAETIVGCPSDTEHSAEDTCGPDAALCRELLRCALVGTEECKRLISETAETQGTSPSGRLASVLLEEWHIDRSHEQKKRPRHVWSPELTMEDIEELIGSPIEWTYVIVAGVVQPDGRVTGIEIVRPVLLLRRRKEII